MKKITVLLIGALSIGSLIAQPSFLGLTERGGTTLEGNIISYDATSQTYNQRYLCDSTLRRPKSALIKASNGKFYGLSEEGGTYNYGTLFEYDESLNKTTVLFNFNDTLGSRPNGKLLEASNGKLYGITYTGGTYVGAYSAVLFSYDINNNTYEVKQEGPISSEGSLIEATNGKLYALTATFTGEIIEYDITLDTLIIKKSLTDGTGTWPPKTPHGSLLQASDGLFYAVTSGGGPWGKGTFFSYDLALDTIIVIKEYHQNIGNSPNGTPIETPGGKIYFTNYAGGPADDGTMEEYTISSGNITTKFSFSSNTSGKWPSGDILLASDGNIYGMTSNNTNASIYKYVPGATTAATQYVFANFEGNTSINNGLVEYSGTTTEVGNYIPSISPVSIYPNPTNGKLKIETTEMNVLSVEIFDLQGKQVSEFIDVTNTIDITSLKPGVYFLRVITSKSIETVKVLKN